MAVALLGLTGTPALSVPITTPMGLNPGDQYRLAFVTGSASTAISTNINDYNTFVTTVANTQMALSSLGTTWTAIGSTSSVDARDNTGTNPIGTGVPIFLLDGVSKIADDNADLWDGTIDHFLNVTEAGNTLGGGVVIWTGTFTDGTKAPGPNIRELGADVVAGGVSDSATSGWIIGGGFDKNSPNPLYAISGVLIVGTAAATATATATATPTATATATATQTSTQTATGTQTNTVTDTPTAADTPTATATATATRTSTQTATGTRTNTATVTPTSTSTRTATGTRTVTRTATRVPNGGACDDGTDCVSTNCVDNTCCAEPSCPPGQSCDNPGNAGVCSQDPIEPAPALSPGGVLAAAVLLLAVGALAVRRRQRGPNRAR
jgi:hypothetical protein